MPEYPDITSATEFIRLRTSTNHADYDRSAWAAMPLGVWWELLRDHPDMRHWLAHNRTAPREILVELAQDADSRVRWRVAMKRTCPPDVLARLCNDHDDGVRDAARRNRDAEPTSDC
jgi:hypothetical protein